MLDFDTLLILSVSLRSLQKLTYVSSNFIIDSLDTLSDSIESQDRGAESAKEILAMFGGKVGVLKHTVRKLDCPNIILRCAFLSCGRNDGCMAAPPLSNWKSLKHIMIYVSRTVLPPVLSSATKTASQILLGFNELIHAVQHRELSVIERAT